jgi:excisionase family DNA binding protein
LITTIEQPRYLFGDEAAEYLRVKPDTFYRWARAGKVPAVKIGRRWRIAREFLDGMLGGTEQLDELPTGT